jgi:hypothetical protein
VGGPWGIGAGGALAEGEGAEDADEEPAGAEGAAEALGVGSGEVRLERGQPDSKLTSIVAVIQGLSGAFISVEDSNPLPRYLANFSAAGVNLRELFSCWP